MPSPFRACGAPSLSRDAGEGTRFAGYAALFDRVDGGGDVVRAGAFGAARRVPVLLEHDRRRAVGWADVREDARGLRAVGRVGCAVEAGRGLSFGYRVRRARDGAGVRELLAVDLVEVSLVARPMQARARVLKVV